MVIFRKFLAIFFFLKKENIGQNIYLKKKKKPSGEI
jgi:hypothetical protein